MIVFLYFSWADMVFRILLTSTSEVYGDPLEHPQKESYWGNVNPIGMFAPKIIYCLLSVTRKVRDMC